MGDVSRSKSDSQPKAESKVDPGTKNNENNLKNISPYMSKDLIAAAGFNVETPIVSAIIGNLTGALPTKKNMTEMIKCEICGCELSSIVVFNFHVNGSKHKKRIKALEIISQLKDGKDKGVHVGDSEKPNAFRCEICFLTVNSAQQLEIHLSGAKHKKKAAKAGFNQSNGQTNDKSKNNELNKVSGTESSQPPIKRLKKEESKLIYCDICNIFVNSKTQYDQHVVSKKHTSKLNGRLNPFSCGFKPKKQ